MEQSPFVITAQTANDRNLLYDTSTGRFASVSADAFACFQKAEGSYAQQLFELGFLTDDAQAQIEAQHALFQMQREDTSVLRLSLAPTYACNCRCAYCYESDKQTSWKFMSPEVERAVYDFVEQRFQEDEFQKLEIEWYGGDPQLCLDLVARMSENLQSFCREHEVVYEGSMLSNCTRIGKEEAQLIAKAGVSVLLVTIDGPQEQHNLRRPTIDGGNDYQKVKDAIGFLTEAGVFCSVVCNCDKVNLPLIPQLQEDLEPFGVSVMPVKLNDYGHFFGTGRFCKPNFDLFTHKEFHQACHDMMKSQGQLTKDTLRNMLSAGCRFCNGQRNNYFIVDNIGDVYKCDGRMGNKDYALFNLLDGSAPVLNQVAFDPTADSQCGSCELLPLCWGNCRWERLESGMPCHPMRTCGEDYLNDYAACFLEPTESVTVLT